MPTIIQFIKDKVVRRCRRAVGLAEGGRWLAKNAFAGRLRAAQQRVTVAAN